jgi:hypothetical protein
VRRHRACEAELVRAEPERRPNRRIELANRSASEQLDRVVEQADTLDCAVGGSCIATRSRCSRPAASAAARKRGRRTPRPRTRAGGPRRRPRAPSRAVPWRSSRTQAPCRRPSYAARLRAVPRAARRRLQRAPSPARQDAHAKPGGVGRSPRPTPRCAARAPHPVHDLGGRTRPVELAVGGRDLSAYVAPSSGCGVKVGSGSTSSSSATAASAARVYTVPASSCGPTRKLRCAAIGPASGSAVVRWIVTPVSASPAMSARSTGAARASAGATTVHVQPEPLREEPPG